MFVSSRGKNMKAVDGSGCGHSLKEHQGVFVTIEAVRQLRASYGRFIKIGTRDVLQLDFRRHVFPLVVLEMAFVYYKTLLGPTFAAKLKRNAKQHYLAFLDGEVRGCHLDTINWLLTPLDRDFEEAATFVTAAIRSNEEKLDPSMRELVDSFQYVVFGHAGTSGGPQWGHSPDIAKHRFNWQTVFDPIRSSVKAGPEWVDALTNYMWNDILASAQGNLQNPLKAACDGVWRDLRSTLSEVLDFGGLTASSHREFLRIYHRYYTRLSNGTGFDTMQRIIALIDAGFVDVSMGPNAIVEPICGSPSFRIRSRHLPIQCEVDVVIAGRTHRFNAERDTDPLYRNLLARGIVRKWQNPSDVKEEANFCPGGLDVTADFHPVDRNGKINPRLTILGAPVEGVAFFQLSVARPMSNSGVLETVSRWANELTDTIFASQAVGYSGGSGATA
jgi:hypothetical protein